MHLRIVFRLVCSERRERYPEKTNAFWDRKKTHQQIDADLLDIEPAVDRFRRGSAARDQLEIGVLYFQRERSPANARAFAITPDLIDNRLQRFAHGVQRNKIVC